MNLPEAVRFLGWAQAAEYHPVGSDSIQWFDEFEDLEGSVAEAVAAIAVVVIGAEDQSVLARIGSIRQYEQVKAVVLVLDAGQGHFVLQALEGGVDDFVYHEASLSLTGKLLCQKLEALAQRSMAQQSLHQDSMRWWTFFESCPIGLKIVDDQGRILRTNRAFEDYLGHDGESCMGRTCQDFTHAEDLARCSVAFREIFAGTSDQFKMRKRFYHHDGSTRWGDLYCVAVRGADGVPREFVQMVVDADDRQRLEEHQQKLEHLVAMGQLAGHVAHDFNNLLAVILSESFLLSESAVEGSTVRAVAQRIMGTAERGSVLTRQLMTVGRRRTGKPQLLELRVFFDNLRELIDGMLGKSIASSVAIDERLRPVWFDPDDLEQVMVNLVLNARDAMPRGGQLRITARVASAEDLEGTRLSGGRPENKVVIAVEDTGCGMTPEVLARIFEPFYSTKPATKGTGLGLSTIFRAITDHGGHVEAHSEPERGSTFKVILPMVPQAAMGVTVHEESGEENGDDVRPLTVIVLESDQTLRAVLVERLGEEGFESLPVGCQEDLQDLLESFRERIDYVLLRDSPADEEVRTVRGLVRQRPGVKVLVHRQRGGDLPGEALDTWMSAIVIEGPLEPGEFLSC
jgi:two-component system, cell cycle sensor histidine kinase and response regulator CckA